MLTVAMDVDDARAGDVETSATTRTRDDDDDDDVCAFEECISG